MIIGNQPIGLDNPPLYDPILAGKSDKMSEIWIAWLSIFSQVVAQYVSQTGLNIPNLTGNQRDAIQSPNNGQLIYNTSIDAPQFYQVSSSSWRTIQFT